MNKELPIEERLMHDADFRAHFIRKHEPKHRQVPCVDFSYFREALGARRVIARLEAYLTTYPLIEDNFPLGVEAEDAPRNAWIGTLEEKYGQDAVTYFHHNKLRGNCSNHNLRHSIWVLMSSLVKENSEFTARVAELKQLLESTGEHYKAYERMNIAERIDLVRKIEDKVCQIFEAIAVKESPARNQS